MPRWYRKASPENRTRYDEGALFRASGVAAAVMGVFFCLAALVAADPMRAYRMQMWLLLLYILVEKQIFPQKKFKRWSEKVADD